ncbi:hypothetical protein At1g04090-like [Bidens hawaiensis]|uniref:hypothetical protein At1g04090-like n=1 Tax=Bidens hawaiensis TaxID=980011 RepID=UPI00404AF3EA
MAGVLLSRFSLHIYITILIVFQIVCNSSAFNDFSAFLDPINDAENVVVSFGITGQSLSYPAGGGEFGNGAIDLGGLKVHEALYFKKIWETHSGGPKGLGATFYEPTSIPTGFSLIGHYSKPNSMPMVSAVLVAKDTTGNPSHGALKSPIDYTLIWTSKGSNVSQRVDGYIWLPIAPDGYKAIGHIVTTSLEKPSLDKVMCVRSDFTESTMVGKWIWGHKMGMSSSMVNLLTTKPITRGRSVPTGMFLARNSWSTHELVCLKMVKNDVYSAMPNPSQITTMINAYAPLVYFHPDEEYFPSSVSWFFENGAEVHRHDEPPRAVINNGVNLPIDGTADDAFLDIPSGQASYERVRKGSLSGAVAYIHVKPAQGGKFQIGPFTVNLRKIGEHVSDWEHITLRVDNFNGALKEVYLSQHARGKWLAPDAFELVNGTRPVVYASLHTHAHYPTPSSHIHLVGKLEPNVMRMLNEEFKKMNNSIDAPGAKFWFHFGFGFRDDAAKSNNVMNIASSYKVVSVGNNRVGNEPWLDYTGRWGSKRTYDILKEILDIASLLPGIVRNVFIKVMKKLLPELLGEEGPLGPGMQESWWGK